MLTEVLMRVVVALVVIDLVAMVSYVVSVL